MVSNVFPSPFFHVFCVFQCFFLFLCHWISFVFFLYDHFSICTLLLDPPFLTVCEAWDWFWYPLTCGPIGVVGVCMEQKSRYKLFLPWPGCEPRTSYSGLGSPAHLDHRALQVHPHKDMGNPKPSTLHQSGQFPSANWSFLSVPIEFFQLLLECHMERNDPCGSSAGHNLLDPSIDL